jgi:hypothetical protein
MELSEFADVLGTSTDVAAVLIVAGVALGIAIRNMMRIGKLEKKEER